jgi:hypothetical protein
VPSGSTGGATREGPPSLAVPTPVRLGRRALNVLSDIVLAMAVVFAVPFLILLLGLPIVLAVRLLLEVVRLLS